MEIAKKTGKDANVADIEQNQQPRRLPRRRVVPSYINGAVVRPVVTAITDRSAPRKDHTVQQPGANPGSATLRGAMPAGSRNHSNDVRCGDPVSDVASRPERKTVPASKPKSARQPINTKNLHPGRTNQQETAAPTSIRWCCRFRRREGLGGDSRALRLGARRRSSPTTGQACSSLFKYHTKKIFPVFPTDDRKPQLKRRFGGAADSAGDEDVRKIPFMGNVVERRKKGNLMRNHSSNNVLSLALRTPPSPLRWTPASGERDIGSNGGALEVPRPPTNGE